MKEVCQSDKRDGDELSCSEVKLFFNELLVILVKADPT